jgi:ABC-type transporter MlaC component
MKKIIILILTLLTVSIFAKQIDRLKKSENEIFNLANEKYEVNSEKFLQRDNKIKKILESLIDYDVFAKNTLRGVDKKTKKTYWDLITVEQQKEFTNLFKELIETAWTKELKKFNNEKKKIEKNEKYKIEYKDEKSKGSLTMVYTIVRTTDETTNIDFRFTDNKITDFIIDERSATRRYRKSFSKHIKANGFNHLIKKMKDKLKEINEKK